MKFSLIFVILFSLTSSLFAGPFQPSGFKYKKDIKSTYSAEDSKVGRILLDEEVFKGSFYGDIRLVQGDSYIPYFRRTVVDRNSSKLEKIKTKLLYKKDEDYQTIFVLELPKLPPGMVYTRLEAESDASYEAQLEISSGSTPNHWVYNTSSSVFRYGEENNAQVELNLTRNRFLRVEGPNNLSYKFPYAYARKLETASVWTSNTDIPTPEAEDNSFVYLFPNETQSPFSILNLKFKENKWEREIKITAFENHEWKPAFNGMISHSPEDGEFTTIPLNFLVSGKYKVEIINGDNLPIRLSQAVQSQTQEEILFYIPEDKENKIELYFGNRYSKYPDFDQNFVPGNEDIQAGTVSFTLEGQMDNPEFRWSLTEPPTSGYIANGLFYLGLAFIAGIGWIFYKKINKESTV